MAIPVAAMLGASAIGAVGSWMGQNSANATNQQIAANANATSINNAREAMQFSERMSNTAHQRETADLIKSGINPLLAVNGGASAPTGVAAQTHTAKVENAVAPALSNALEASRAVYEAKAAGKSIEQADQDIALKRAQTTEAAMRTAVMSKDIPKAEMLNEAYKKGKEILNSIKNPGATNAKSQLPPAAQSWRKSYMENFHEQQLKLNGKK